MDESDLELEQQLAKPRRKFARTLAIAGVIVVVAITAWWFQWPSYSPVRWRHAGGFARAAMVHAFDDSERWIGATRDEVVAELGEPDDEPTKLYYRAQQSSGRSSHLALRMSRGRCVEAAAADPAGTSHAGGVDGAVDLGAWKGKSHDEIVAALGPPDAQSHWLVYSVAAAPPVECVGFAIDASGRVVNVWIGSADGR